MKRLIYRGISGQEDEPVEIFWIAGLSCNDRNEWLVRTVFRGRNSGNLYVQLLPIGMLPVLGLGTWFEHGLLKLENATGEKGHVVVPDLSRFEIITSAEVPPELYRLPPGKTGTQRLFRYRTKEGDVIIPVVELVRALFLHNRSLALALMRPAGIEQLFYPETPGYRERAHLRFTREMPKSCIGNQLAREFAWIVLDEQARRSWDGVQRLTHGMPYVMFDPPAILQSTWSFRGIRHGGRWFVMELNALSGRRLPFDELEYSHPEFKKVIRTTVDRNRGDRNKPEQSSSGDEINGVEPEFDVNDGEAGSTGYRNTKTVNIGAKRLAFENQVKVQRLVKEVEQPASQSDKKGISRKRSKTRKTKTIEVTAGERASKAKLPPLDFKTLASSAPSAMGDLDALDETVRHMRDMLPEVEFEMSLVQLKPGRAISSIGGRPRPAMVVVIRPKEASPIALLDIERTGIAALSLVALHFTGGVTANQIEAAVKHMLDGTVDSGGHWSSEVEMALAACCRCERIPKMLIPRERLDDFWKYWAIRLTERLGLRMVK